MANAAAAGVLTFDTERKGDGMIVHCHGRLIAGVSNQLYTNVKELIPGSKRILIDLTDLTHMDSMGLGTLVRLYVSAKSAGCCLELINLGPRIRQLLGMTNLLSVLTDMCEQGITLRF
jgi:anti-sigma B factor antagonist